MTAPRTKRKFPVILLLILICLIGQLYVPHRIDSEDNCSPNHGQCAHHPKKTWYPFESLTMMSHQDALDIQTIWEKELAELTLQRNRSVTSQTIEAGGQPERVIVISTWKSGSTYLGTVVRSRPGTHYFFEPLHDFFEGHVVRQDSEVQQALEILHNVFHCRDLESRHLTKSKELPHFFSRNFKFSNISNRNNMTWDPGFVTFMCRRSPILAMKTVRLKLRHASSLLADDRLNLKVIYLVRDPRAIMNSRLHLYKWCSKMPDCIDYGTLCSDLVDNFNVAKVYERDYPQRFMVVKYEDLLLSPRTFEQLSQFLQVNPHVFNISSTAQRESQLTKWTRDLSRNSSTVRDIQVACKKAMELWAYVPMKT